MQSMYVSKSIIHIQNVFLLNPIEIYTKNYTEKYLFCYEPKKHTFHYLYFKIDKKLVNGIKLNSYTKFSVNTNVDINVKAILKSETEKLKGIEMRIIPTKHQEIKPLYGIIYIFNWRKTGAGGRDLLEFTIPECPIITNSKTINDMCYKLISIQKSYGGSHGIQTYLIIAPSKGQYQVGQHVKLSNINNTGHRNLHVYPVVISL